MAAKNTLRAPDDADILPAVDLHNRVAVSLYGEPDTSEAELREQWSAPGFSMATDVRLAARPDGSLAGVVDYFNVRRRFVRPFAYAAVDPEESDDVRDLLVEWAVQRATADIPRAPAGARITMLGGTESANASMIAAWQRAGFTEHRRFYQMRIEFTAPPQPATVPRGYSVRTMRSGEERAVYDVAQDAFRDHFGYVPSGSPDEDYRHWRHYLVEYDGFDPETQSLAVDENGAIAGMCLCRPDDGVHQDIGWVTSLAVLRDHRKRGIGEALLRWSFSVFHAKGKAGAGLAVDADSLTRATRLYEKCGMHQHRVFLHLAKVIREGEELANLGS